MPEENKEIQSNPSPTQGEKDVQKPSTEYKEQVTRKHPHGETGEDDKQAVREHPHGFKTTMDKSKKRVKRKRI